MNNSVKHASTNQLIEELRNRIEQKEKEINKLKKLESHAHINISRAGESNGFVLKEGETIRIEPSLEITFVQRTLKEVNEKNE